MEFNEKQIEILETAEKLFAANGFDGTSVREIAREANINLASISYYFGSKEKLMEAIFNYRINNTWFAVRSIVDDNTISPIEKMYLLVDSVVDRVQEKALFHRIMIRQQIASKDDIVTKLINESRHRNIGIISEIVKEGQQQKLFKENIDTSLIIITMIGTIYQMMHSLDFYREVNNLESLDDVAFQLHIRQVLKTHLKHIFKTILINEA